jgi:hypothetical protein
MHYTLAAALLLFTAAGAPTPPDREAVTDSMQRATTFMFDTFANRGGFVWWYTEAGTPYGELKARQSMIWVEPPSTPTVGLMLLEAHRATGDARYLAYAERVADALIAGQHPSGGWNYFIDFDPDGLQAYYDAFFSKCWGWQEYLKKRDNATFDDFSTTEPTRFFMALCEAIPEPRYVAARDKALAFILDAQYPNGSWPQRYPIPEKGADYSAHATFNDDVIMDCIRVLSEAHKRFGDAKFEAAARRGMDYYLLAQQPSPQAGWAQQHGMDLKPAWGRPFEIDAVCTVQTYANLKDLMEFYIRTGDAKYLKPFPDALAWMRASRIPGAEGFTHTSFYEHGTNRPLYILQTGTTIEDVNYEQTYEEEGCYPYAHRVSFDLDALEREYETLKATPPDEALAAWQQSEQAKPLPHAGRGGHLARALAAIPQTDAGIADILATQNPRGGWTEPVTILDPYAPFTAPTHTQPGYVTGTYIAHMYRMINYLNKD